MPAHKSPNPKTDVFNVRVTPAQAEHTRVAAAARGVSAGEFIRAAVARELHTLDIEGNPILATREEADRMADLRRKRVPVEPPAWVRAQMQPGDRVESATAPTGTRYWHIVPASAGTRPPASPSTKPAPSPSTKPRPVRRESEREELERLRAEAYARLTDFERADAAKIKDPVARARFIVARLARRAKR